MPFTVCPTTLPDVLLITPRLFGDPRGWFMETYQQGAFTELGITSPFVQDNCSRSTRNVLRGLHFQLPPHAQGKLVLPLEGEIWDVLVDLRTGSPTYGKWESYVLSAREPRMLWAPPGFAHGFCVLSQSALFWYKVTAPYAPAADAGLRWNDPDLAIHWPVQQPLLSPKDESLPLFRSFHSPF